MTLLMQQILAAAKEDPKTLPKGLRELRAETAREVVEELANFFIFGGNWSNFDSFEAKMKKKYASLGSSRAKKEKGWAKAAKKSVIFPLIYGPNEN